MGFIGLALDGARVFLLHNDLQDVADAAAIAGAASLDGTANAQTNADAAARSLSVNDPTTKRPKWWNTSSVAILPASEGIQFFDTLSDLEARPPTPTKDPKSAHYIKVITGIWSVAPTFLVATGAVSNASVQASAVAKAVTVNCRPLSMMLCNPYEPTDGSSTGDTSDLGCTKVGCAPTPGQMFVFSTTGNTGGFSRTGGLSPGVFNFIDPTGSTDSDPVIERYLSQQIANACQTGGIRLAQGQKINAPQIGINVRFDRASMQSGVLETAAPIVIDGIATGPDCKAIVVTPPDFNPANYTATCNSTTDPAQYSCPLPYDVSFLSTGDGSTHIGTGTSDTRLLPALDAYWRNHHGGVWPTDPSTGMPKTRYQAYLDEVSTATSDNNYLNWLTKDVESRGPACLPVDVSGAARRIVSVAVVDCLYWDVRGNSVDKIPINTYANFFVTNPTDRQGNIHTEYVETHQINEKDSGLYRIVRLVK
jgi:hypothetical protein